MRNFQDSFEVFMTVPLTLFRMSIFGAARRCFYDLPPITYKDETWHSYNLPKDVQKIYVSRDTYLKFY